MGAKVGQFVVMWYGDGIESVRKNKILPFQRSKITLQGILSCLVEQRWIMIILDS